jgi:hypothetical protein
MTRGTYWGPALLDSQYAVFHFDVKSMSLRDSEGNYLSSDNDAPLVFEDRAAAETYCRQKIRATPALGCRIYDHRGQVVQSFSDGGVYDRHHGQPAAKRNLCIGIACLLAGVGGVALDAWLGWSLTFGVLLGVRFLWVGTSKTADGIAGLRDARAK